MAAKSIQAADRQPAIAAVNMEAPWKWLALGWNDLWQYPALSLGYGLAAVVGGYLLFAGAVYLELLSLMLPLAATFMLLGPMLAVGLYEKSRRLAAGETVHARDILFVGTKSPTQLAFLGVLLMLFALAWIRFATLLFALFYGLAPFPPLEAWIGEILFTPKGLIFVTLGSIIGGILAVVVFATSVISVPMLMTRETDALTAIVASWRAVLNNPKPMLLWGWLIALLTAFGLATLFVGLIVTFPLVGHATWHAYRSLVEE